MQHLRYALRNLAKQPAFTDTVAGSLALGIGAWDPMTFSAITIVIAPVALLTAWSYAARVDPIEARRIE